MKNVTFSLCAFHLCHTFTDAPDEMDENADRLWENLVEIGRTDLQFPGLAALKSKLICYQNDRYNPSREWERQTPWLTETGPLDLGYIPTPDGFKIGATLTPFRDNDTYIADLTLSPEPPSQEIQFNQLQYFKAKHLIPSIVRAELGQTFLLYAEVEAAENTRNFAEQFAIASLAGTSLNPVSTYDGSFFGCRLYEFQAIEASSAQTSAQPHSICHILIVLNDSQPDFSSLANQGYDSLLSLLCCRHKIRYIQAQARESNRSARTLYAKIDDRLKQFSSAIAIPDVSTQLDRLQTLLAQIPIDAQSYTQHLSDLHAHCTAIDVNIANYEISLKQLAAIGETPPFWQQFLTLSRDRDRTQIQTNIDYLSPITALFQQAIDTIRGTVEIEQAKIDRASEDAAEKRQQTIERLIFAVSTGLAISGVSSQVINEPVQTLRTQKPPTETQTLAEYCSYGFLDVIFHLAIGFIPAIFVWWIISRIQQRQRRT